MIQKFQQGGASQQGGVLAQIQLLPKEQQAQIMQAFAKWALDKGVDIKLLQLNPQALELALGLFVLEIQQGLAQAARHGAKLNYVKSLKHQCADDEELYYFKKGGSLGCGCKKKEDGGKIKVEDGWKAKFKNRKKSAKVIKEKCGSKMKKEENGGIILKFKNRNN